MSTPFRRGLELVLSVLALSVGLALTAFLPWFLALLVPGMIVWWTVQYYRNKRTERRLAGLCPACGYHLRATPERCPECGSVTRPAASAMARPRPSAG